MSVTSAGPSGPSRAPEGPGAPAPRRPDVDASMRLLRELLENPVDPSYAQAAARRRAAGAPRRRSLAVLAVVALVAGWGVTRGVAELRRPLPGAAASRSALEEEIGRRSRHADDTARRIDDLRAGIAAAQAAQLNRSGESDLAARIAELSLLTGETAVTGPGIEVALDDAPSVKDTSGADPRASGTGAEDGRVLDRDIQVVVNGLWAAGAEAIAINGRRLTTTSAIRSAGQAVLVDFRPLVPPYKVQAIGDPSTLSTGFAADQAGSYVQLLRDNYGVSVAITTVPQLRLPAAGSVALRVAKAPSAATPSPSAPSGSTIGSGSAPAARPSTSAEVSP